jgi:hypothetical protein
MAPTQRPRLPVPVASVGIHQSFVKRGSFLQINPPSRRLQSIDSLIGSHDRITDPNGLSRESRRSFHGQNASKGTVRSLLSAWERRGGDREGILHPLRCNANINLYQVRRYAKVLLTYAHGLF